MENTDINPQDTDRLFNELLGSNLRRGYYLNPDQQFTKSLLESLLVNEKRYGYQSCPCRLATGQRTYDLDIICPCYYRDPDIGQFGACYCGLYVSKKVHDDKLPIEPIPERRPAKNRKNKIKNMDQNNQQIDLNNLKYPIWRCQVCGYICARDEAPDVCPICGASHDRFEKISQ